MNNKGFMMAEVVVVSAIILVTLTGLYTSYNKVYGVYKTRLSYYDAVTLYKLSYYRDILIENGVIDNVMDEAKKGTIINVYDSVKTGGIFELPATEISKDITDTVFFVSKDKFDNNVLSNQDVNLTFREYIQFLSTSATIKSNYVMFMERCNIDKNNSSKVDIDNCKYAYLEVYDGYEAA